MGKLKRRWIELKIGQRRPISRKGNPPREFLSTCHFQFSVRRLTTARLTRIPAQVDLNCSPPSLRLPLVFSSSLSLAPDYPSKKEAPPSDRFLRAIISWKMDLAASNLTNQKGFPWFLCNISYIYHLYYIFRDNIFNRNISFTLSYRIVNGAKMTINILSMDKIEKDFPFFSLFFFFKAL